jgi:hypothetical protein
MTEMAETISKMPEFAALFRSVLVDGNDPRDYVLIACHRDAPQLDQAREPGQRDWFWLYRTPENTLTLVGEAHRAELDAARAKLGQREVIFVRIPARGRAEIWLERFPVDLATG